MPRDHIVEAAFDAAIAHQEFAPFEEPLEVLSRRYEDRRRYEHYAARPCSKGACATDILRHLTPAAISDDRSRP